MLPFVEVSHLPSSASFYSAITQPLGLQYISAVDPVSAVVPETHSITYGLGTSPPAPVFELRQVRPTADRPLKLSRLVFSARSPSVVRQFQAAVQRLNGADSKTTLCSCPHREISSPFKIDVRSEAGLLDATDDWRLSIRAIEPDLDGNTMEVVYIPPSQYPESFTGSTVRKTNSTEGEISRIMTWNYDVAKSDVSPRTPYGPLDPASPPPLSARLSRYSDDDMAPVIRRTITTTTVYGPIESPPSPRQSSNGLLSTGAVVGLLGLTAASAAIGAGVAYGVMKERTRQDLEPPSFQRRSTYPEPLGGPRSRYSEYEAAEKDYRSIADRRPPPTLLTRYPASQGPRDADSGYDDGRSRHSSRFRPSGTASIRARSEVSSGRKPLLLTDVEHRSHVGSKHSARTSEMEDMVAAEHRSHASSRHTSSKSRYSAVAPSIRHSSTYDAADADTDRDRDSYVSTRSHRTASTVRGPPRPTVQTELTSLVSRPKAASRVSGATGPRRVDSYAPPRETPPPPVSRAASYTSARRLALPASGAGGSRAEYEDDACSIAPSDSISCIGSRRGSRVH